MKTCRPRGTVSDRIRAEARDMVGENTRYVIHALCCTECDCAGDARMLLSLAGLTEDEFLNAVIAGELGASHAE